MCTNGVRDPGSKTNYFLFYFWNSLFVITGVSYVFGTDVIAKFLKTHDLDLMARAHQVVEDGYEFCANRRCVTVFSAPQYCGEFDNAAGMLLVNEDLVCSFKVLKSRYWK